MFGNRKKPDQKPRRENRDLSQFGLFDIPDDFDPAGGFGGDDDHDSDLEAELTAITAGGGKPKPKPRDKKTLVPTADLDRMVAESLKDIGSDEDLSGDDDDPDLLGELQEITGERITEDGEPEAESAEHENKDVDPQIFLPTTTGNVIDIIKERIKMYEIAEESAKATGESGRARRFNRGLKTLKDLLKQASAGKNINVDDIPPEVSVKTAKGSEDKTTSTDESKVQSPTRPAPAIPTPDDDSSHEQKLPEPLQQTEVPDKPENPKLKALNLRKHEYKIAALDAKKAGDKESAMQFVKILKQFDMVIKAAEQGQEVDLSDMPPPPSELKEFMEKMQSQAQAAADEPTPQVQPTLPPPPPEPEPVLETPTNILEALQQRLEKYKSVKAAAEAEGNSGKARRFGRIVKQYEDAIKLHKAGKSVPFEELPTPPGFGPLPIEGGSASAPVQVGESIPPTPASPPPVPPRRTTPPQPASAKREADSDSPSGEGSSGSSPKKPARKHENTVRVTGNQVSTTLMEKQMAILLERQKEFKLAAVEAKKAGEIEQAKEYLKIYKGFESLLDAASGGLPVDMSTLPIPPSQRADLEDSFAVITTEDGDCEPGDDISDISVRLEEQLAKQLMMCKNTRDHHRAMGDIAGMNRFENLALSVQKDLDLVRYSRRKKIPIPKFHYEQKSFNIVHCNTDITDNEVEINVIRGISYNVPNPKDVDTYVKIEFPYPQDDPFRTRTTLIKNTDSPDYDQKYTVEIQRANRQCQRVFKRHGVKFEIYSRGGFLRSDILIGTVTVKLQPLETKCEIHDSFDLMDGRKTVGGKLEVRIRVRNPILAKQIEHLNEKWLVLDH